MLTRLSVENYALIESLEMELSPSLNIITGETGAGKSILLGALGLIMGNRADTSMLSDTGRNCIIEGTFDLSGLDLEEFFSGNEIDYDTSTVIRRVITPAGKSRAYVNDLPVQLTLLRELSARLIDIHSQHQSLMIGDEGFRIGIVDSISAHKPLLESYRRAYFSLRDAEKELALLRARAEQNRKDEDYLRFQYEQIAALKLHEGEQAELETEQRELANAGQIRQVLYSSLESLESDETGVLTTLKAAEAGLRQVSDVYSPAEPLSDRVRSVLVELKDIAAELSAGGNAVEDDPARLSQIDIRLDSIYSLIQKHHVDSADALIALGSEFSSRLEAITSSEEALASLGNKIADLRSAAQELAQEITLNRKKAADELAKQVERTLERLGMPGSRFIAEIMPAPSLAATGGDEVRFMFTANRNAEPQPLEKIASGGEISRVMLTLKSLVARSTMLPTIIFDEIDSGVSGRIADATGGIIVELAEHMQVINITHLPQVASKGDTHFFVYKDDEEGITRTHIRRLDPEERITEIAKMLSGSQITDAALTQARLLLDYR